MSTEFVRSIFNGVDLHSKTNNNEHHTSEISVDQLIVRRGQPFTLTLKMTQSFNPDLHPLIITAVTGKYPSEDKGTMSYLSIPDGVQRSPLAKAVWKIELHKSSSPLMGNLILTITPPADTPIGEYHLNVKYRDEQTLLAKPVVLFNPWCPDDWVFLPDAAERQEYVMNEQGIIYQGSGNNIYALKWDFGQFEENMVDICMKVLENNLKYLRDPVNDVAARCNPIYISRVVSAMINSQDDHGVLMGRWDGLFGDGVSPSHWSGSYTILQQWIHSGYRPVKYGQCWVFAGVLCSVMRLLGIPCRVVTNFQSAHDSNKNLTIDVYHADDGVEVRKSRDSIWNYHVWVEAWMRRPDLAKDGKYDGWQVVDSTPQELSNGVWCCGPAPVKAIRNGNTDLKYDVPFVFAEVNADTVDWLVKADGSKVKLLSDTKRIGQNISTKSVASNKRMNITDSYKYREGTKKERDIFNYAITRDLSGREGEETEENGRTPGSGGESFILPKVSMRFEEVSKPVNGEDVRLNLVLHSESSVAKLLTIKISVMGMRYNSSPLVRIQAEMKHETLLSGKDLSIPILIPFSAYRDQMQKCDSMKVSAIVQDRQRPQDIYLAENDVVLLSPPVSVTVVGLTKLHYEASAELIFMNPVKEILKDCTITVSGSGLLRERNEYSLPDLNPNTRMVIKFFFVPYKTGEKTLMVNFNCSTFKNTKGSCTFYVRP